MELKVEVDGWYLTVEVTYYQPEVIGRYSGRPEDCYPTEPEEITFEVTDYEELCATEDHLSLDELLDSECIEEEVLKEFHTVKQ